MSPSLTTLKTTKTILDNILEKMNVSGTVAVRATEEMIFVTVDDVQPDAKVLIGHSGDRLLALQLILSLMVHKATGESTKLVVDIEEYRKKREQAMIALARRFGKKVMEEGGTYTLDPLRPFERRIVHLTLREEFPEVDTESIGEDPNRQIVISQKA